MMMRVNECVRKVKSIEVKERSEESEVWESGGGT